MTLRRVWSWVVALGLAGPAWTQNQRINPELARALVPDGVFDFRFTPDGTRVVYSATTGPGRLELFSRPLDAATPSLRLNGPLQPQGSVYATNLMSPYGFLLAAGGRVVFVADEDGDRSFALYSASADGSSSRILLSAPAPTVLLLGLDPSGSRAIYKHRPGNSVYGPLHVVPVDGSAAPLHLGGSLNARNAWATSDGTGVLFATLGSLRGFLYVSPLDGSGSPLLLDTTPTGVFTFYWYFDDLVFTSGGDRAVYHYTVDVDGDFERTLHSVPLDGSLPAAQIPGYQNSSFNLASSIFALDSSTPQRVGFRNPTAILSAELDGSPALTVSLAGWSIRSWPKASGKDLYYSALSGGHTVFRVPSDGSLPAAQVFPTKPGAIDERFTLASPQALAFISSGTVHVVDPAGGTPVPLHPAPPAGQAALALIPHPDGQRILFRGDLEVDFLTDLFVAPLDASAPAVRLNDPRVPNGNVAAVRIAPGGARAGFQVTSSMLSDLFVVPVDASAPPLQLDEVRLGNVVGDVTHVQLSPGGRALVFRADVVADEHFDLLGVGTDPPGEPIVLTGSVSSVLEDFTVLEPGPRVVFRVGTGLYVAGRAGAPILLDASTLGFGADVAGASGGRRLIYRRAVSAGSFELRSVLLDGTSPSIRLHGALPANRSVADFDIAADETVIFRSDLGQDDVFELFAVPAKGGSPRRLSAPLVVGGDVEDFQVDPNGKYVAFLADALVDQQLELFALALDGAGPPERRSGSLHAQGDVAEFAFAGDGLHMVYRSDQAFEGRFDLFSTPIVSALGGASGPRRSRFGTTSLSDLSGARDVQPGWQLTPDGSAVVYRANPSGQVELFRVLIDGSARPTRLGGALVATGAVSSFALAAAQGRVVYLADERVANRIEIFSAPLDGGPSVPLDVLPDFGDVTHLGVTPSAREVVFRADRDVDAVFELYRAPVDGSTPALRVNGSLAQGGDAGAGFFALDALTLYLADQASDELFELFATH